MDMVAFCAAKRNTTVPSVKRIYALCRASRSTTSGSTMRQPPQATAAKVRPTTAAAAAATREPELPHTRPLAVLHGSTRKPNRYKQRLGIECFLLNKFVFVTRRAIAAMGVCRICCLSAGSALRRHQMARPWRTFHPASKFFICHSPTVLDLDTNCSRAFLKAQQKLFCICAT